MNSFTKNISKKDGLNSACRDCHVKYTRAHYKKNQAQYVTKALSRKRELYDKIAALKQEPCADCKQKFNPWQMDFDHVTGVKLFDIASGYQQRAWKAILDEIAKCELVCANCHRERTHQRSMPRCGGAVADATNV